MGYLWYRISFNLFAAFIKAKEKRKKEMGIEKMNKKSVGIFQAETYCTTRSMKLIIHTRDNI